MFVSPRFRTAVQSNQVNIIKKIPSVRKFAARQNLEQVGSGVPPVRFVDDFTGAPIFGVFVGQIYGYRGYLPF